MQWSLWVWSENLAFDCWKKVCLAVNKFIWQLCSKIYEFKVNTTPLQIGIVTDNSTGGTTRILRNWIYELQREKTYFPSSIQRRFRAACIFVQSNQESSLRAFCIQNARGEDSWFAKDAKFLVADSKNWSDCTGWFESFLGAYVKKITFLDLWLLCIGVRSRFSKLEYRTCASFFVVFFHTAAGKTLIDSFGPL